MRYWLLETRALLRIAHAQLRVCAAVACRSSGAQRLAAPWRLRGAVAAYWRTGAPLFLLNPPAASALAVASVAALVESPTDGHPQAVLELALADLLVAARRDERHLGAVDYQILAATVDDMPWQPQAQLSQGGLPSSHL